MPTAKPRISVTLEPDEAAVLRRLSLAQGRPVSSIVHDLLAQAVPTLEDVAATMEALQAAGEAAMERLASKSASDWETAQKALQPRLEAILGALHGLSEGLAEDASSDRMRERAAPSEGASSPPYTNRGVRPTQEGGSRSDVRGSRRRVNG
jgi:hypothetical protein